MISDEFELIKSISQKQMYHKNVLKGIGDDAAVVREEKSFDTLICMDTMVEGVHFTRNTLTPFMIGYKALAVNISDIAAMGGLPTYFVVSIAVSSDWDFNEIQEIYAGMNHISSLFSVDLIGGDTVSSPKGLIITVSVYGKTEKEKSLYRSSALNGDVVFVTGEVGHSAAGLELLLNCGLSYPYNDLERLFIQAHQSPLPQVKAGRILSESGQRIALNDISDGVASEANELAEASGVTLFLDFEKLPTSIPQNGPFLSEKRKQWLLYGGEDYQLIGTMAQSSWPKIKHIFDKHNINITLIGHVEKGSPCVFLSENGKIEVLAKKGYNHFKKGEING